jgi:hypothetical protein
MARRGRAIVVAMALLAACSSNGDTAPTSEATSAPATTPSTTDAPATTVAPATTSTTAAPPTTTDPADSLAAEVEAAFLEADRLGREASMDPFDPEKEAAALDRRLGVIRDDLESLLADYRARNYALRENSDTPPTVSIIDAPGAMAETSDVARLEICEVNSWILVEVGAGPNGVDAVIDPTVVSSRATVFLRLDDGVWKIEGGNQTGRWEGASECPD